MTLPGHAFFNKLFRDVSSFANVRLKIYVNRWCITKSLGHKVMRDVLRTNEDDACRAVPLGIKLHRSLDALEKSIVNEVMRANQFRLPLFP